MTGTGTHRRMTDSPVPVSVITAKEIGSANVSTLEEALVKLTPNISSYTNGMGTTMSLNGINEDYILILETADVWLVKTATHASTWPISSASRY